MRLNRNPRRVFGRRYAAYRDRLEQTDAGFDNAADLLRTVNRALVDVPYYRDLYGATPLSSVQEFKSRIGFIDRDVVAAQSERLVSRTIDRDRFEVCTTGGTSGEPLRLLVPRDRYVVELATMHSIWARAGYHFDVRAVIRNHRLPDGQLFAIHPVTREVIFDGFRLDETYLLRVLDEMERRRIRFVHCYPSVAHELGRVMERHGRSGGGLTFLSGSENVLAHQRELIEGTLGARFFNWYGHSEKLVLAGFCEGSNVYHVESTYGFFELVDARGEAVTEVGKQGEIVGTTLNNHGMPLIRYKTGDRAELAGNHCSACGRSTPLLRRIEGRWNGDRIYRRDGSYVTTTALNVHDDIHVAIRGMQYIQHARGELTVLVIRATSFTSAHEDALRRHFHDKFGRSEQVEIRYVDRLERHPNGKFSMLMSRMTDDHGQV